MDTKKLKLLAELLTEFMHDSVDREESDKRESLLLDVLFEISARGEGDDE